MKRNQKVQGNRGTFLSAMTEDCSDHEMNINGLSSENVIVWTAFGFNVDCGSQYYQGSKACRFP